jgi:hypothetical protein
VSEVPPADPPIAADPPADAPAHAGPSPLSEKFERLMRIGSGIVGALFLLSLLFPMELNYGGGLRWIWDSAYEWAHWRSLSRIDVALLVNRAMPVVVIPLMVIAAWPKRSPIRLFAIAIAALVQFGLEGLIMTLLILDNQSVAYTEEAAASNAFAIGLLAASAGCTGLAMGTRRAAWRLAAGLGGALLALGCLLLAILRIGIGPHFYGGTDIVSLALLILSSLTGSLAGGAGIVAALRFRRRVSFAKACLFGLGASLLLLEVSALNNVIRLLGSGWVSAQFAIKMLAGYLLGWLFLTAMLQSFSPIEERATA